MWNASQQTRHQRIVYGTALIASISAALLIVGCSSDAPSPSTQELTTATSAPTNAPTTSLPTNEPTEAAFIPARIGFTHENSLWLWTEGGDLRQLSSLGRIWKVDLSDDGQMVAFLHSPEGTDYFELWVVNSDGSNERILVSGADLQPLHVVEGIHGVEIYQVNWVPGTHTLVYTTAERPANSGRIFHHNLHLVDADTGTKSMLLARGEGGTYFVYSPDGSQIALATPGGVSLINADGSNHRRDVFATGATYLDDEGAFIPIPIWSPDSTRIRFIYRELGYQPFVIWDLAADGSEAVQLGSIDAEAQFLGLHNSQIFSPDLNQLAFIMMPERDATPSLNELHILSADGANDIVYEADHYNQFFGWTPDGGFVYRYRNDPPLLGYPAAAPVVLHKNIPELGELFWIDQTRFIAVITKIDEENFPEYELYLTTLAGPSQLIVTAKHVGPVGTLLMDVAPRLLGTD
jgi:hypothetical protein